MNMNSVYVLTIDSHPVGIETNLDEAQTYVSVSHPDQFRDFSEVLCPNHLVLDIVRDRPPTEEDAEHSGTVLALFGGRQWAEWGVKWVRAEWGINFTAWTKLPTVKTTNGK